MGFFRSIGGVFTAPPEIVPWGQNDQFLFAFGVGADQALWYAQLDGFTFEGAEGTWSSWRSLEGTAMSPPHAVRSGESSVDVFAVGARSDLLHWQFLNGEWTSWPTNHSQDIEVATASQLVPPPPYRNWESLGGILTSPPHAIMLGDLSDDNLCVFALGTDHALWIKQFDMGSWRDWATYGHTLNSPPHVVRWGSGYFAAFGLGIDSAIWYTMGGTWQSLGGSFSSAPYAVSTSKRIHVFAADTQRALHHRSWDGNSWTDWESLGGILMSPPTANNFQSDELIHVFGLGTDSAIWRRRWLGDSWTDWHSLGGPFLSAPATVTRLPDPAFPTRDLAALRANHEIWHMEEDDS
jgi:hypothetical protein